MAVCNGSLCHGKHSFHRECIIDGSCFTCYKTDNKHNCLIGNTKCYCGYDRLRLIEAQHTGEITGAFSPM